MNVKKAKRVLYFAYGSNMNADQMASRCDNARIAGIARLADHAVSFHGHSERWDGGEETVAAKPGEDVYGVVYDISLSALDRLDSLQGVRLDGTGGYFHSPADVVGSDGAVYPVVMYLRNIRGEIQHPSAQYLAHILAGATARGLPSAYVEKLKSIPSVDARYEVPRPERGGSFQFASGAGSCAC
jgi:gamma-glutamylcyclotransferase